MAESTSIAACIDRRTVPGPEHWVLRQRGQRASQLDQSQDELPEKRGRLFGGRSIRSFDGGAAARKLLGRQAGATGREINLLEIQSADFALRGHRGSPGGVNCFVSARLLCWVPSIGAVPSGTGKNATRVERV